MARRSSHIASIIELLDLLPIHQSAKNSANQNVNLPMLGALANYLSLPTNSVGFGKVLQWTSVFAIDGRDAILRSTLADPDKQAALGLYDVISSPFRYPFAAVSPGEFLQKNLSTTTRSHLSLLNAWVQREHPIFVPETEDISKLIEDLAGLREDFSNLNLPDFLKTDFDNHLRLYELVATKLPFAAHQLLAHESSKLAGWLLSGLPAEAKSIVSKAAITINVLVAAFVAPSEATEAYGTYYDWLNPTRPEITKIEATVAPLALPSPAKSPKAKK